MKVDLLVIGAGSGGTRAARIASGYGAKVAIVEASRIGGTCVVRGCVPKKLYVYGSRFRDAFEDSADFGWSIGEVLFDWTKLVRAKEKEVTRLSGLYRAGLEASRVSIIESHATIIGPNAVRTSTGQIIQADRILVATGGKPDFSLPIPGLELAITSDQIFDLKRLPRRLLVVGGGYIAVEFSSIFTRLGTSVIQAFRADLVLRGFDDDLRSQLTLSMMGDGIDLKPRTHLKSIERSSDALRIELSTGESIHVDEVLLATGRVPNTNGLGLQNVGIATDSKGAIVVDANATTNVGSIFAVGDVTDRINLTPVAIREGHTFADRVFGGKNVSVDYDFVPTAVFTTPEIGSVGLSEEQARSNCEVVDVYSSSFRPMRAALSTRAERTFLKIIVDGETDRVIGVHGLGHEMGEMAQLLAVILRKRTTKAEFDATMALHPTVAEEFVTMRTRTARYRKDADVMSPSGLDIARN